MSNSSSDSTRVVLSISSLSPLLLTPLSSDDDWNIDWNSNPSSPSLSDVPSLQSDLTESLDFKDDECTSIKDSIFDTPCSARPDFPPFPTDETVPLNTQYNNTTDNLDDQQNYQLFESTDLTPDYQLFLQQTEHFQRSYHNTINEVCNNIVIGANAPNAPPLLPASHPLLLRTRPTTYTLSKQLSSPFTPFSVPRIGLQGEHVEPDHRSQIHYPPSALVNNEPYSLLSLNSNDCDTPRTSESPELSQFDREFENKHTKIFGRTISRPRPVVTKQYRSPLFENEARNIWKCPDHTPPITSSYYESYLQMMNTVVPSTYSRTPSTFSGIYNDIDEIKSQELSIPVLERQICNNCDNTTTFPSTINLHSSIDPRQFMLAQKDKLIVPADFEKLLPCDTKVIIPLGEDDDMNFYSNPYEFAPYLNALHNAHILIHCPQHMRFGLHNIDSGSYTRTSGDIFIDSGSYTRTSGDIFNTEEKLDLFALIKKHQEYIDIIVSAAPLDMLPKYTPYITLRYLPRILDKHSIIPPGIKPNDYYHPPLGYIDIKYCDLTYVYYSTETSWRKIINNRVDIYLTNEDFLAEPFSPNVRYLPRRVGHIEASMSSMIFPFENIPVESSEPVIPVIETTHIEHIAPINLSSHATSLNNSDFSAVREALQQLASSLAVNDGKKKFVFMYYTE